MITTVYKAKTHLSELLHEAEKGTEVLIQRGKKGPLFQILPVRSTAPRNLKPLPAWKSGTRYEDEEMLESEWEEDDN